MTEEIKQAIIEDEMKQAYLDYSMSVIVGRALPDVKDGLKPVHRRILFAMNKLGLQHNKRFSKCAGIVGECLKSFHPHGDSSVYDALVRLAQNWSLRYPLIHGQGNFGNIDGDPPAAYRYCLIGDTLILTDKGIMPIKNISNKKETKINLKILSYDCKKNKASKFFNSGRHKTIKLTTKSGYSLEGTYNHPVLIWELGADYKPQICWKLLEKIGEDDILILNRKESLFSKRNSSLKKYFPKKGFKNDVKLPENMNEDLAFLLGSLVSEGSFHNDQILFNNKDKTFYNKVRSIIKSQFKGIQLYERKIKGDCTELAIYEQKVVKFLKNIGLEAKKSHGKEIPFTVLLSNKKSIRRFLIALFEGGGGTQHKIDKRHGGKNIWLCYDSKSKQLIKQLKVLLLNFGIITSKINLDKRNNLYRILIPGYNNINIFHEEIGFFSKRKKEVLKNIKKFNKTRLSKTDFIHFLNDYLRNKYNNQFIVKNNFNRYKSLEKNYKKLVSLIDKGDKKLIDWILKNKYYFDQVISIEKSKKEKEVFSVKVESKCHSFVANGFINHNTEAKLSKISSELLKDIDKETIPFVDNFDGTLKEPVVLPSMFPNLLINGSSGIAVGMATNMPPHNIKEVCNATITLIDNPDLDYIELMKHIKGPDFPTGGIICGTVGIRQAYKHGRGKITVRAKCSIEDKKIIVTEIPYQVNKASLIEHIASLVREKRIEGISDLRDESDRQGMRIVIELKTGANPEFILNKLYKNTSLQTTFGVINLVLVDGQPKVLNLNSLISEFIKHRKTVVTKRTQFEKRKAQEKAHLLEGLLIALKNIDEVIPLIKSSKDPQTAKESLIENYSLTEIQAQTILDMKLQRLTSLENEKIATEHTELLQFINKYREILASEQKIKDIIKEELTYIKDNYSDERKTKIKETHEEIEAESLIKEEKVVVTMTHSGYVKRLPLETYKAQRRGGKGIKAAGMKEEDFIEHLFITKTHNYILFFSNKGQVYWLKAYEIPEGTRYAKGTAIVNLLSLGSNEKITSLIPIQEFKEDNFLIMATKNGLVKKTSLKEYSKPRKGGIIGINLREGDSLVDVKLTDGTKTIFLATEDGRAVRFNESNVNVVGRNSIGVRGIKIQRKTKVIGMCLCDLPYILTVTEKGYGKRTKSEEYRLITRGGSGVKNIKITSKNGKVVGIKNVGSDEEIMLISKKGILIRTNVNQISVVGRATQGVRTMRLTEDDKLVNVAKIPLEE